MPYNDLSAEEVEAKLQVLRDQIAALPPSLTEAQVNALIDAKIAKLQPPPPAPAGTLIGAHTDLTAVFSPQWVQPATGNSHFTTINTDKGPGFYFSCTDSDVPSWDNTCKAILAVKDGVVSEGLAQTWDFQMHLPPQQLMNTWHTGVLWEFHTATSSGHNIALNADGTFRLMRQTAIGSDATSFTITQGPAVPWNTWSAWRLEFKWSQNTDGFYRVFMNGNKLVDSLGRTMFPGDGIPKLQFGWYSKRGAGLTNRVTFADIRYRNI